MKKQPVSVRVYQPLPARPDGKCYGVGGLHTIGLGFDFDVKGITKECAEFLVKACKENPDDAANFVREFKRSLDEGNVFSNCGCRFENERSTCVVLCDTCSEVYRGGH